MAEDHRNMAEDDEVVKLYEPTPPPLTPFLTALKSLPYELASGYGGDTEKKKARKTPQANLKLPPLRGS